MSISFRTFGSSLSSLYSKLSSRRKPAAVEDEPSEHDQAESSLARAARIKPIFRSLYNGLASHCGPTAGDNDPEDCQEVIASDLEWWFHGPPGCDYMMRMLTGQLAPDQSVIRFEPRSIEAVGDCVIAEGWEGNVYWVHVWTVREDHGLVVITQFREYFNTWLTVKYVTGGGYPLPAGSDHRRTPSPERITLWRSQPADLYKRSLPGLVLAI
ncbi:unnamed protein product [Linum trigynum]|uniref:Wound-induced protein 1 n=1 Tax=Linum trigynum TaxID=586398 RepID=A0AAV2DY58_9ROSI